jgi:hypothetical protein
MDDEDPEFQKRWESWHVKNRLNERALNRNLRIIVPVVLILGAAVYASVMWAVVR